MGAEDAAVLAVLDFGELYRLLTNQFKNALSVGYDIKVMVGIPGKVDRRFNTHDIFNGPAIGRDTHNLALTHGADIEPVVGAEMDGAVDRNLGELGLLAFGRDAENDTIIGRADKNIAVIIHGDAIRPGDLLIDGRQRRKEGENWPHCSRIRNP